MFHVGSRLSLLMEKKLSMEGTFTQKKFKSLILPGQPCVPTQARADHRSQSLSLNVITYDTLQDHAKLSG